MNDPRSATENGFSDNIRPLFGWSGVCIAELDDALCLREANAGLLRHLGRRSEEIYGLPFSALLHHGARQEVQNELAALVAGDNDCFSRRVLVTRKDGTLLVGQMTARPRPGRGARTVLVRITPERGCGPEPLLGPPVRLRPVEACLLEALAVGASTARMAAQLSMSEDDVEYRITALLRTLEVRNRPALVAKAHATGLFAIGEWPPSVHRQCIADG